MRKHVWIGKRFKSYITHPYEVNLIKKGWNGYRGWDCPLEVFCEKDIENKLGIKLRPGEVAKLELKLIKGKK